MNCVVAQLLRVASSSRLMLRKADNNKMKKKGKKNSRTLKPVVGALSWMKIPHR